MAETECLERSVDLRTADANALIQRYDEPQRHYHNLAHVNEVWHVLAQQQWRASVRLTLWLATWYHDAIYDPQRTDNEVQSARLAANALSAMGLSQNQVDKVVQIIMATQTHDGANDPTVAAFLDADRAILGSARDVYRRYVAAVRREFAFVSQATFRMGRSRYLCRWLQHKQLFHTDWGRHRYERPARANLRWELATWWLPWCANPV